MHEPAGLELVDPGWLSGNLGFSAWLPSGRIDPSLSTPSEGPENDKVTESTESTNITQLPEG